MNQLLPLIEKAKSSRFYLWVLNVVLLHGIPFNKPHRLQILNISDTRIQIKIPYRRKNLNHLKGLHACCLATVAEYATGLLLISRVDPARYRLIMKSMEMDYHYQGKLHAVATFEISDDWLDANVFTPLESEDSIMISPQVEVHDMKDNHLVTGKLNWQIKRWDKVRTAV